MAEAVRAPTDRRARLARLERLAETLDARFRIPGLGIPVGWDSILGLIPGVGDLITAGPAAVMIYEAHRMGARKRAMARMGFNTGVDLVLGGVPLLGDAFDVFFKAHRKNVAILKTELDRIERKEAQEDGSWQSETARRTEAATPTGSSDPRARSTRKDGRAESSPETSEAATR